MSCKPFWYTDNNSVCPFGTPLPGDVTWQKDVTFWTVVSVFYSYVPYLAAVYILIRFLWWRGTRDISFVLFGAVLVGCNELILKKIVSDYRPGQNYITDRAGNAGIEPRSGTCLHTCGMPSSHAAIAIGLFLLFNYENLVLIDKEISTRQFVLYSLMWTVILIPVPYSREILLDHTTQQVMAGMAAGLFISVPWIVGTHFLQKRWQSLEGNHIGTIKGYAVLRHTLAPPLNYSKGSKFESMSQEQTKEAQSPAHEIDLEMNVDDSSDFAVVDSPVSRLIINGRGKGHGLE